MLRSLSPWKHLALLTAVGLSPACRSDHDGKKNHPVVRAEGQNQRRNTPPEQLTPPAPPVRPPIYNNPTAPAAETPQDETQDDGEESESERTWSAADDTELSTIYATCDNSLRTGRWAALRVDTDAMNRELQRIGLTQGHTRVAVVDSGFDYFGNRSAIASKNFSVAKGHAAAGDPQRDENGHGTMVAGVIAGRGIGVAPQVELTVYRVTGGDASGSVAPKDLDATIEKACNDGNEIINVSWGGVQDEAGMAREEVTNHALFERMARKGCLVVKAAGNDSYRQAYDTDRLDDNLLRVASISATGGTSDFSSRGEISAPGENVLTLHSKQSPATEKLNRCQGTKYRFTSGTSFASPIAAGIAAQTLGVLKAKNADLLQTLTPQERPRLISRILKASEHAGSISGARAVLIAERLDAASLHAQPESLRQLLMQEPANQCVAGAYRVCDTNALLDEQRACVANIRSLVASCPNLPLDATAVLSAINVLSLNNHVEPAAQLLATLMTQERLPQEPATGDTIKRFWEAVKITGDGQKTYSWEPSVVHFDYALMTLTALTQTGSLSDLAPVFADFFASSDTLARLAKRDGRGTEQDLDAIGAMLSRIASKDAELARKLLSDWINTWASQTNYSEYALRAPVRIMDWVAAHDLADAAWLAQHDALIIERAALLINQGSELAEAKPSLMKLSWFGDLYDFQPAFFTPFLRRNQDGLRQLVMAGDELKPEALDPSFVLAIASYPELVIGKEQDLPFALSIAKAIANGRGWTSNRPVLNLALSKINQHLEAGSADTSATKQAFVELALNATSPSAATYLLPYIIGDLATSSNVIQALEYSDFQSLYDVNTAIRIGRRFYLMLLAQDPAELAKHGAPWDDLFKYGLTIGDTVISDERLLVLPRLDHSNSTRLDPPAVTDHAVQLPALDGPAALDRFLGDYADGIKTLGSDDFAWNAEAPFKLALNGEQPCKHLPRSGSWRGKVESMLQEMPRNGEVTGSIRDAATKLLSTCPAPEV